MSEPERILPDRNLTLGERFRAPDSYGLLLVLILVSIVTSAAASGSGFDRVVALVFLGGTLLFAMYTSRAGHKLRRVAWVLTPIMVVGAAVADVVVNDDLAHAIVAALSALLLLASFSAIIGRLKTHTRISFQTVLGALSMYLLLGLLFASIYDLLALTSSEPFFAQGASSDTSVNFVYFSYVTISTVGYGDLSAAGSLERMLAASEALIGQLFLVTIVALFVTNLGKQTRRVRVDQPSDGGSADRSSG